jgi:hypothetical protein
LTVNAPVEKRARNAVWRAFKVAFRSQNREVDVWEAEFVSDALLRGSQNEGADPTDIGERVMSGSGGAGHQANIFEKAYVMAMLPLILGAQVVRFAIFISSVVLIGPIVSFMWRARRHLADAMAIQLTRYPDGLASALRKLTTSQTATVKGTSGLEFLFFVWPGGTSNDAVIGQFGRMHPKLHQRQRRIRALGASNVSEAETRAARWNTKTTIGVVLLGLIIGPLMALALGLSIVALAMLTMLTLMVMTVLMLVVWFGLKLVFVSIPAWVVSRVSRGQTP